jgi:tRNA threonylcarbamoyl adenosine modification protein YjeE
MSDEFSGKFLMETGDLERVAERFASLVRRGDRFFLVGDLGTGKSTFARAYIRALGVSGTIPSPSFIMDSVYRAKGMEIHHVDLFRLECSDPELELLGLQEVLDTADVVLVEWADRLGDLHLRNGLLITLGMTDDPHFREVRIDDRRLAGD